MHDPHAEALLTLLAEERAALRVGDLTVLPDLADRKSRLSQELAVTPPDRAAAARIAKALARNARLLAASRDGIRAAQARLAALKDVRSGLSLYTARGDRTTVAQRPDSLEHKA